MLTIDEARSLYETGDTAHDFDHVLRVLALAEQIGREEGADPEIVRTAALLHDVGRAEESRTGRCHAAVGAERAREILAGQPPQKVEAVAAAIASHRFREGTPPASLEARVLYDADKLDAIGAVGVARAYVVGGRAGQRVWGDVPAGYGQRDGGDGRDVGRDPEHTPVHEFVFKLARIKDSLFTDGGRRIAAGRHEFMVAFFQRLDQEVAGRA
jgi:uncharacterized protein